MKPSRAQEAYLVAVFSLQASQDGVRSANVARRLGYSRPSVCRAVRRLGEMGLVRIAPDKTLHLTAEGTAQVETIRQSYLFITRLLDSPQRKEEAMQ